MNKNAKRNKSAKPAIAVKTVSLSIEQYGVDFLLRKNTNHY